MARRSAPPDDLTAFYAEQYGRVRGTLALFTGDRGLAEELAQEAFARTCERWEQVRRLDAPGAWVHRVAINLAISRARRRRTEVRTALRLKAERAPSAEPRTEDDHVLRDALAALPAEERAVVVLRYFADLSVAGVAQALAIPEGTVKTRTRRALAALRTGGALVAVSPDEVDDVDLHDQEEVVS